MMDGTVIFLSFGVVAAVGVLLLHCRSFSRNGCQQGVLGGSNKRS